MTGERRLVRLSEVEQKPLNWLWPGYLAIGTISNLSGDPGGGKSRIAYDIAARVSTGQPLPGCTEGSSPAGVVLLQGEDAVDTMVRPALVSAGADLQRVAVPDANALQGQPLVLPNDMKLVEVAAAQVQAKLVVVDPVTVYFPCNHNSAESVRAALRPLTEFAEAAGIAVLLVQHLNKSGSGNPLYKVGGSTAWIAAARSAMMAINDPTSSDPYKHLLVPIKTNLIAAPSLVYRTVLEGDQVGVEWLGASGFTVRDLNKSEYEDGSRLWEAMEVLYLILRDGPLFAAEVVDRARYEQVAKRTLERAKAMLRVKAERKAYKSAWRWVWRLPDDENAALHYLREKYEALDASAQDEPPQQQMQPSVVDTFLSAIS